MGLSLCAFEGNQATCSQHSVAPVGIRLSSMGAQFSESAEDATAAGDKNFRLGVVEPVRTRLLVRGGHELPCWGHRGHWLTTEATVRGSLEKLECW